MKTTLSETAMKTTLSENTIRARFSSRIWAVNLDINGHPVNHDLPWPALSSKTWTRYYPFRGEVNDHAFERFVEAVEEAAAKSLRGPAVLEINAVEDCDDDVIDWLTILLQTGREMAWCDGTRVELDPANLIVNLWLDEDDPATAEVVERIVG